MAAPKNHIQPPVEVRAQQELAALAAADKGRRPTGWALSPRAVVEFVMGSGQKRYRAPGGEQIAISPKFVGDVEIVQVAVATLASDRALLLVGEPGTAKSWLSEHLAAAISGTSQLVVQGSQGTTEEHLRYGWSPALLIAEGHSRRSLVPSPLLTAMEQGKLARIEEVTRLPAEVSDALISILSEKALAIPELGEVVLAERGFNVIATANTRDRGVNEMSSALKRRFGFVVIPLIADIETEVALVRRRVADLMANYQIEARVPEDLVKLVVTVFSELRQGKTLQGEKVKSPSTTLSTAEAISVVFQSAILGSHFGRGEADPASAARALIGAVAKEDARDVDVISDYIENHARRRPSRSWQEFYVAARKALA